ncbi:MAG: hypothetical protein JNM96_06535, partial [Bacteroidia bacterium]|nr:hypothetical protein [Bacteroidia bacterium]
MKIFCTILFVCMALFTQAQAPPPSVTITPILPSGFWTPYLNAKLVIKVYANEVITPAQYFSQTLSNNIINIEKCYAPSVLPASSTYIDTLSLGPLAHGSYTVNFKFLWTLDYPNCD